MKKTFLLIALLTLLLAGCNQPAPKAPEKPLAWADDAVMYEVNVRQFTPEGTFNAFAGHLPRLKAMGVEILWFMPIHPIGIKNRKGILGSYYSIRDYKAVNPDLGTFYDFKSLVAKAHEMGFKVLIDCVANHTAWDNVWMENHKDWYTQDSLGNIVPPVADWYDVADLNYNNPDMRAAMLDAMKFWVAEADIDGYRCDHAEGVPIDFWETARVSLDSIKPVFMLAENEGQLGLLNKAFNCNYGWTFHHMMNSLYSGKEKPTAIPGYFEKVNTTYPVGTYPLQFTDNHDENYSKGTVFERLGDAAKTFAVLTFTVPGMPLMYTGQEAGLDKRLAFFEKDQVDWALHPEMAELYTSLIKLKKENPALWNGLAGGQIHFLDTSLPEKWIAFEREKDGSRVVVVINLSAEKTTGDVAFAQPGKFTDYFSGKELKTETKTALELEAWGYKVLVKK
jgi:glycosidase